MQARSAPAASRLAWLDALRGLAVLFVVYEHLGDSLLQGARRATDPWFPAGRVGVYLFFLVSGYIIPASLERHGNLRSFWVNRAFRLFPLYLVVIAGVVALHVAGPMPMDPQAGRDIPTVVLAHLTMLPALVHGPMALQVTWTLAFEMAFYLLVTALFALRWHRASATVALAFAAAAIVLSPLPVLVLSHAAGTRNLTIAVIIAVAVSVALVVRGPRWLAFAGAGALAAVIVALLAFNQELAHSWDGLVIPAVMFLGTVIYRAHSGQIPWHRAALVVIAVASAEVVTQHRLDLPGTGGTMITALGTVAIVGIVFAAGMWWGGRWRVARPVAWLGVISYSIYMVHDLVILALAPELKSVARHQPLGVDLAVAAGVTATVVALAALTYRWVEKPAQTWGGRLNRWVDGRSEATPGRGRPAVTPSRPLAVAADPVTADRS